MVRVGLTGIHRNLKIGEEDENKNEYQVHKVHSHTAEKCVIRVYTSHVEQVP